MLLQQTASIGNRVAAAPQRQVGCKAVLRPQLICKLSLRRSCSSVQPPPINNVHLSPSPSNLKAPVRAVVMHSSDAEQATEPTAEGEYLVSPGDVVTIHFTCKNEEGEVVETTRDGDPITFEVGAGDVVGNKLFQAFDEAVRGLYKGQSSILEATGGEWRKELVFSIPRTHEEIERLEGRYKNQGGLQEGQIVELSNKQMAVILKVTPELVQLDVNNLMAGKMLTIEVDLIEVEPKGVNPNNN